MVSGKLAAWFIRNPGLITVLGALIIFFSWMVTNTLGQSYSALRQSLEAAESSFRLYTTLHELRESLSSLATETVYIREQMAIDRPSQHPDVDRARQTLPRARRTANQIRELTDFAVLATAHSDAIGTDSEAARCVQQTATEILAMSEEVHRRERAAEAQASLENPDPPKLAAVVAEYARYVQDEAIPKVRGFYERIVPESNQRGEEGRLRLRRARQRSLWAGRAALVLYLIGSTLALGGQYIDKVYNPGHPKAQGARP